MKKNLLKFNQLLSANMLKVCCSLIMLLTAGAAYEVKAQLPTGFTAKRLTTSVIQEGVELAHAPDGRIFIAQRNGIVKVLQNGVVSNVHTVSTTTDDEQGLLGITLHPQFSSNGKVYIFYFDPVDSVHKLDVFTVNAANQVTSSTNLTHFDKIINGAHNGGCMLFKNGLLYVAIGESNVSSEATKPDTYRGKILRLTDAGQPAPGNPFYDVAGASVQRRSTWAMGMRNPWRMSLDPVSGKIFVVNVGGDYEEINDVTTPDASKNYNYGWDGAGRSGPQQAANTILPVFAYPHPNPNPDNWGCAITTALFFNPATTNYPPQYRNRFYFSDWCQDWFRSVDATNPGPGTSNWTEFAPKGFTRVLGTSVGIDGNIYYISYAGDGAVWRIEFDNSALPDVVNQPVSQTVVERDAVSFSVTASGAVPMTFQWQKNNVDISGATNSTFTINQAALADSGFYRCIVSNANGKDTSAPAKLTVTPFNARPVPHILTPASTVTWSVGTLIGFSGTATDEEDGTLPDSVYQWKLLFFHKDNPTSEHSHPGPGLPQGVKSGTFAATNLGETSPNVWLRLFLTVTDKNGRTGVDSVDIQPNKVNLTALSNIAGIQLVLSAQATTPVTKTFVVGTSIGLQALSPQVLRDTVFEFDSWADGGTANRTITVPAVNTTYTANFKLSSSLQNPYSGVPAIIPGKIEAEDYDRGGEGIAYHDLSTANQGGGYRPTEGVDLEGTGDGGTQNFNLSYVSAGEWTEYTINVSQAGPYVFTARVATPYDGKTFHIELDGVDISGTINVPKTGGFQAWQNVSFVTPSLTTGNKVLRLVMDASDVNYNYFTFALSNGTGIPPTVSLTNPANGATFFSQSDIELDATAADANGTIRKVEFFHDGVKIGEDTTFPYENTWIGVAQGTYVLTAKATDSEGLSTTSAAVTVTVNPVAGPKNIPGRIEAEDFNTSSDVGKENVNDDGGGQDVGWIGTGDWMDYVVLVSAAGTYNVDLRLTCNAGGGVPSQLQLQTGGNVLSTVTIPNTGGWQNWITVSTTVTLAAGQQTLRVYASGPDWNFNWMEFSNASAVKSAQVNTFKVYPNPTSNILSLNGVKKDGIFNVTNMATGQTTQMRSSNGTLNVNQLPAGTYIIKSNVDSKVTQRFIKL